MQAAARAKDHQRLLNNLKLIQRNYLISELSELLGVSRNTWTAKMKEPWRRFSYDELRAISEYCKIDFMVLMDGELKLG